MVDKNTPSLRKTDDYERVRHIWENFYNIDPDIKAGNQTRFPSITYLRLADTFSIVALKIITI